MLLNDAEEVWRDDDSSSEEMMMQRAESLEVKTEMRCEGMKD